MMLTVAQSLIDRLHERAGARATMFKALSFGLIGFVNTAVDFAVFSLGYYLLACPSLPQISFPRLLP